MSINNAIYVKRTDRRRREISKLTMVHLTLIAIFTKFVCYWLHRIEKKNGCLHHGPLIIEIKSAYGSRDLIEIEI